MGRGQEHDAATRRLAKAESLPSRDSRAQALLLLSKAQADKVVIDKLAGDTEVTDDMIGFHAQQAVEKLLKAVLANLGIGYPRTHDIDRLVDLLADNDVPASASGATRGRAHVLDIRTC